MRSYWLLAVHLGQAQIRENLKSDSVYAKIPEVNSKSMGY